MATKRYYNIWLGIIARCNDPDNKSFKDYGGRGIVLHSTFIRYSVFEKYIDDHLGDKKEGESLDRIDVNAGYVPNNLRWADAEVQNGNKRNNSNVRLQQEIRSRKAAMRMSRRGLA